MTRTANQDLTSADHEFAAPSIVETDEHTISLALLRSGFTVKIPPIPNAVRGNSGTVAVVSKYGMSGKPFTLDDPTTPISIRFEPDQLQSIAGNGHVQYVILQGPVGTSEERVAYFQEPIPTPQVKGFVENNRDDFIIPGDAVENGLTILIPPYENMAPGDSVTLFATASRHGSGVWQEHSVTQDDVAKTLEFPYEADKLTKLVPGTINLGYTVSQRSHRLVSHLIDIAVTALLAAPEPVHQETDPFGNKLFLAVVEFENGEFYAPVTLAFGTAPPQAGERLMLVIDREGPGFSYVLEVKDTTSEVTFRIPESDLQGMGGQDIVMSALWQQSSGKLLSSLSQKWRVLGGKKGRVVRNG
ncbi:hypothetical protein [Pseudomonas sp. RC10]|uniref:hypothetical protein n=1 Tax=Pseudomonas bambusae TaxID=3139142 RepID=UPI0031386655